MVGRAEQLCSSMQYRCLSSFHGHTVSRLQVCENSRSCPHTTTCHILVSVPPFCRRLRGLAMIPSQNENACCCLGTRRRYEKALNCYMGPRNRLKIQTWCVGTEKQAPTGRYRATSTISAAASHGTDVWSLCQ